MTEYIVEIAGQRIETSNLERQSKQVLMDFVRNPLHKQGVLELYFTAPRMVMKISMVDAGVLTYREIHIVGRDGKIS